jgi:hypothetical protein
VPYYAQHRDLTALEGHALQLYGTWEDVRAAGAHCVREADVAMVTSYCPDAQAREPRWCATRPARYARLLRPRHAGDAQPPRRGREGRVRAAGGFDGFDLVLSYTGGRRSTRCAAGWARARAAPLRLCRSRGPLSRRTAGGLQGRPVVPRHLRRRPAGGTRGPVPRARATPPAPELPHRRFAVPRVVRVGANIYYRHHVSPPDHPAFFSSCGLTLNVTRGAMADDGLVPVRPPVRGRRLRRSRSLSDWWEGLDAFFEPGREILVAHTTDDALAALDHSPGRAARARGTGARARARLAHGGPSRARLRRRARQRDRRFAPRRRRRVYGAVKEWPCGVSSRRPVSAAASSHSRSRRNCCLSAAVSTASWSARGRSPST